MVFALTGEEELLAGPDHVYINNCFPTTPSQAAASDEVTNMIKNKALTKSTKEDELFCETERKKRKLVKKKITWSKNLIQVQILLDYHYSDSLTEE